MYFSKRFDYKFRVLISATSIKFNIMDQCLSLSITDLCYRTKKVKVLKIQQSNIDKNHGSQNVKSCLFVKLVFLKNKFNKKKKK